MASAGHCILLSLSFVHSKMGIEITPSKGRLDTAPDSTSSFWASAQSMPSCGPGTRDSPPSKMGRGLSSQRAWSGGKSDQCSDG